MTLLLSALALGEYPGTISSFPGGLSAPSSLSGTSAPRVRNPGVWAPGYCYYYGCGPDRNLQEDPTEPRLLDDRVFDLDPKPTPVPQRDGRGRYRAP